LFAAALAGISQSSFFPVQRAGGKWVKASKPPER